MWNQIKITNEQSGRSQRPRGLRSRSAAGHLLGLWFRIPPGPWRFVCYDCCVLSGSGLCDELITRPEESYLIWGVGECDLETSWMRRPWPTGGGAVAPKTNGLDYWRATSHTYIHTYVRTYVRMYFLITLYIHTYIHACMYVCMHFLITLYIHTYIYTYIHTFQNTNLVHNSFNPQQYVCHTTLLNMFRAACCSKHVEECSVTYEYTLLKIKRIVH